MCKKMCVCVMSMLIALTTMPGSVFASENDVGNGMCSIGEQNYATLQEAVDNSEYGDVIALNYDCSGDGVVVKSGKSITFDFNGHAYTVNDFTVGSSGTETNGFQLLSDSSVTMKNGIILHGGSNNLKIMIQNYSDLTLQDIVIDGTLSNGNSPCMYVVSNNCGNVNIEGCTTLIAPSGTVAFDVCNAAKYPSGTQVTLNTEGEIIGDIEYGVWGISSPDEANSTLNIKKGYVQGKILVDEMLESIATAGGIKISGGFFCDDVSRYVESGYVQNEVGKVVEKVENPFNTGVQSSTEPISHQTVTETKADGSLVITTTDNDVSTGVVATTEVVTDASGSIKATSEVKAPAEISVESGAEIATISAAETNKIIEDVEADEKTARESGAGKVESIVEIDADITSTDVSKIEFDLPAEAISTIVHSTCADIVLATPAGQVKLDHKTLETVADTAALGMVKITAEVVKMENLPEKVRAELGADDEIIDLSIQTQNGKVSSFNGGKATVSVPVPEKLNTAAALYVRASGNVERVNYHIEEKDGKSYIVFETGHFSYYAIMSDEEAEKAVQDTNKNLTAGVNHTGITIKSQVGKRCVKIMWKKALGYKVDGYKVYRATSKNGKFKLLKTTGLNSFTNTKLTKGKKYYYKVKGYRNIGGRTVYTKYSAVVGRTAR